MTISLCMIVRDEADHLPRCLASVQGLVDECIILDTGSTDNTVELAQARGASVYAFDWIDDFAAARNAALSYVTSDWVLVLDADEILQPEVIPILQALDRGNAIHQIPAEQIVLVNLLRLELESPQTPYSLVSRFFRHLPDLHFTRPYHETVDDQVNALLARQPHWQVVTLPMVAIHHRGYAPVLVAQRQKSDRARTIMERYLEQAPEDAYTLNKLGALYVYEQQWDAALALLNRALALDLTKEAAIAYELYYHRGLVHRHQHRLEQAMADYGQALEQPILPVLKLGAYINLGSLKKLTGDLTDAIKLFQAAIGLDPTCGLAYYNLGLAQRSRGNLEAAVTAYRQAIACQPNHAEAYQNLGVALIKLGQVSEALPAFSQALQIYDQTNPTAAATLRQGLQGLGLSAALLATVRL